jgi:UMP-CMP kinase
MCDVFGWRCRLCFEHRESRVSEDLYLLPMPRASINGQALTFLSCDTASFRSFICFISPQLDTFHNLLSNSHGRSRYKASTRGTWRREDDGNVHDKWGRPFAWNESASLSIIFVLGGPGAGKCTQCALMAAKYGFAHLSLGDILREEVEKADSRYGAIIAENMREGRAAPKKITIELLRTAIQIQRKTAVTGAMVFFIDGLLLWLCCSMESKVDHISGFPHKLDQAILFEESICAPECVLVLECPDEVLQERLQKSAWTERRLDDNTNTIGKRLRTFREATSVVLDRYEGQGKLVRIVAAKPKEEVLVEVETRLMEALPVLV